MQVAEATKNEIEVDWEFHERQTEALDLLSLDEDLDLLYGGAKGGGKTVLGCRWMFIEAVAIIEQFGLEPTKYPIAIGFMGRKRGVDFTKTTLETWKREIPAAAYRINEQKHEIIIHETIKYHYGGFDDRANIEKFNSAEYCRAFLDQAEELSQDEVGMLGGAMRLKINGRQLKYKILMSANPAQCWLKREFVKNPDGRSEGTYFVPALPKDNPYLPTTYLAKLQKSYRHRPELLSAYLEGSWDALEGADIVIKDKWVRASHNKGFLNPPKRKIVAVDVARFGDDRTVIFYMEETNIADDDIYGHKDTHYTSGKVAAMANKHKDDDGNVPLIVIDGDGVGGPVADNLRAWGFKVIEIHSAAASDKPDDYYNLRAQMWWEAGEMFSDGDIVNEYEDEELDTELTIPKYSYRNGKILIESKEDIKKPERYGKSTDLGDCYVYGLYGLKFWRPPKKKKDGWRKKKRRSAMAA